MFLETKRLVLREFSPEDFEDVHEYSSDYENVKHMVFGPNTPEQTRDYAILAEEFADGGNFDGNDHVPHAGQRY